MRASMALNGKDGQPARGPQATFLKPRRALPGWLPVAGLRHWLKQLGDTAASFPRRAVLGGAVQAIRAKSRLQLGTMPATPISYRTAPS